MARKGRTGGSNRRQRYILIGPQRKKEIREYSKFVPSLRKLKGKDRLTPSEQAAVTRAKRDLQATANLKPVTDKQAQQLRKRGLLAEVQRGKHKTKLNAVRLRNTSADAKVTRVTKDGVIVVSNGRTWKYYPIRNPDPDKLADMGEELLKKKGVRQINIWTNKGRMSAGYTTADSFAGEVARYFEAYEEAGDFIEGIAAWEE